jgi:hypothetical protein
MLTLRSLARYYRFVSLFRQEFPVAEYLELNAYYPGKKSPQSRAHVLLPAV